MDIGVIFAVIGTLTFVAYLSLILYIATAFYSSANPKIRVLFWVIPLIVVSIVAGLFGMGSKLSPDVFKGLFGIPFLLIPLILFSYCFQFGCWWWYIFRCQSCGHTYCTYRTSWRSGVYRCPNCNQLYLNGLP